jgi:hypothetical protein
LQAQNWDLKYSHNLVSYHSNDLLVVITSLWESLVIIIKQLPQLIRLVLVLDLQQLRVFAYQPRVFSSFGFARFFSL